MGVSMLRVAVFLDYQNVSLGARDTFFPVGSSASVGAVDPYRLGQLLAGRIAPAAALESVHVYRGIPDSKRDPKGYGAAPATACGSRGGRLWHRRLSHEAPALSPGMAAREGAGEGRGRGARRRLRQHGCTGRLRHGGALFGRTPTCGRRSRRWSRCASRGTPIRAARSPRGATRRPASSRRVWRSGPLPRGATGSASPTFRAWRTPATTRRPPDVPAPAGVDCVILPSAPRFIRDPLTSNAATSPARGAWCSRRAMPARAAGSCPRLRPCGASSSSNVVALFFRSMNGELRTVDIATIAASLRVAAGSGSRGAATLHHGAEDRARRATRQAVHGAEIKSGEVRASTPSPRMRFGPRLVKSMTWPTVSDDFGNVLGRVDDSGGDRDAAGNACRATARVAHVDGEEGVGGVGAGKSATESAASMSAQDGLGTRTSTSMIAG